MRGITEGRLRELELKCSNEQDKSLLRTLVFQCQELNPWQPIDTAPKDRRILLYNPKIGIFSGVIGDSISAWNCDPTHWQELPEDPK